MSEVEGLPVVSWRERVLNWWASCFAQRQDRILLFLSVLIGALTGYRQHIRLVVERAAKSSERSARQKCSAFFLGHFIDSFIASLDRNKQLPFFILVEKRGMGTRQEPFYWSRCYF
jgi:hypothetical protein